MGTQAAILRLLSAEGTQESDEATSAVTVAAIMGAAAGTCILALVVLLLVRHLRSRRGGSTSDALARTSAQARTALTNHDENPLYDRGPTEATTSLRESPLNALAAQKPPDVASTPVWPAQAWMMTLAEDNDI